MKAPFKRGKLEGRTIMEKRRRRGKVQQLGIIGLGKIGGNLSLQAIEKNIEVVGMDRSEKPELAKKGVKVVTDVKTLNSLKPPRIIFLSLPAGPTIDHVLNLLIPSLDKGDIIIDGGNSFFRDSMRREKELSSKGIYFLDCGTSGGVEGARKGACFMIGGKPEAVKKVEPILKKLAAKEGLLHTGEPGSGHFVKLVHNGIEFGMLQAIGEGVALLKNSEFNLDLQKIFRNWAHGSVIRGWLIELMEKGLREKGDVMSIPAYVEDTREVNWLVEEAIQKELAIPVITISVLELFKWRDKNNVPSRAVALLRHEFGGHPFGEDEYIKNERKRSRISPIGGKG
jgi:6-phosphogluconate dehydrogenase